MIYKNWVVEPTGVARPVLPKSNTHVCKALCPKQKSSQDLQQVLYPQAHCLAVWISRVSAGITTVDMSITKGFASIVVFAIVAKANLNRDRWVCIAAVHLSQGWTHSARSLSDHCRAIWAKEVGRAVVEGIKGSAHHELSITDNAQVGWDHTACRSRGWA